MKVKYDSAAQQLIFQVPDAWLPKQDVGGGNLMNYTVAQSSTGLLLNYDSYYTDPHEGSRSVATWMEQRLFSNLGFISNTGTYRYNIDTVSGEGGSAVQDRYLRYDTFWRYSDEQDLISYQLGILSATRLPGVIRPAWGDYASAAILPCARIW